MAAQWVHAPQLPLPVGRLQPPPQPYASIGVDAYGPQMDLQALLSLLALMQGNQRSKDELTFNRERLAAEQGFQTQTKQHQDALLKEQARQADAASALATNQFDLQKRMTDLTAQQGEVAALSQRIQSQIAQRTASLPQTVGPQIRAKVKEAENRGVAFLAPELSNMEAALRRIVDNPNRSTDQLLQSVNAMHQKLTETDGKFENPAQAAGVGRVIRRAMNMVANASPQLVGTSNYETLVGKLNTLSGFATAYPEGYTDQLTQAALGQYQQNLSAALAGEGSRLVDNFLGLTKDVGVEQAAREVNSKFSQQFGVNVPLPDLNAFPLQTVEFGVIPDTTKKGVFGRVGAAVEQGTRGLNDFLMGATPPTSEQLQQSLQPKGFFETYFPFTTSLFGYGGDTQDPVRFDPGVPQLVGPPPLLMKDLPDPWAPR